VRRKKDPTAPEGIAAERLPGGRVRIWFYGDVEDEEVVVDALELAEALARLEAPGYPTMSPEDLEDEPDDAPNYYTADVAVFEPIEGVLVLRRVKLPGPDLLEFNTPAGSVYEFPFRQTVEYLRRFLPR